MLRSREPSWEHPSTQRYHTVLGPLAAAGDAFKERWALVYPVQRLLFVWMVIVSHRSLRSWSVGQSHLEAAWSVLARAPTAAPRGHYPCCYFSVVRRKVVIGNSLSLLERAAAPSDRLDVEKLSPLNGICALSPLSRKYLENTVSLAAFHGAEGSRSTARAKSRLAGAVQRCAQMEKPLCWKRRGGNLVVCPLGTTRRLQTVAGRSSASPRAGNVARTDAWLPRSRYGPLDTRWGS